LQSLVTGHKNVVYSPLINPEKAYVPPSTSNLDSQKISVKAMDRNYTGFMCLKYKFPKISDDKIKEGIFVGELIENVKF
jgi:hypothetical protein